MQSFLSMYWDPSSAQGVHTARQIRAALAARSANAVLVRDQDGFLLADLSHPARDNNILTLASRADAFGAMFGLVFPRSATLSPMPPVRRFSEDVSEAILETRGQSLTRDFWGPYIAFLLDGASLTVRPDPAGALPCYFLRYRGVTFIFSNLEKVPFTDYRECRVDWAYVSQLLAYDKLLDGQTGISGLRELLPGDVLTCTPAGAMEAATAHDPRRIASKGLVLPDEEAAHLLGETVRYVVRSQAAAFGDIAISLSGGLDSSIVLACLAGSGFTGTLTSVHYVLGSSDGPERGYAAAAAAYTGCAFECVDVPPGSGFPGPDAFPLTPRPFRPFMAPDLAALAPPPLTRDAAWMTGQGGDHLFLAATGPLGFADYLSKRGWDRGAGQVLLDTARMSGLSIWSVLARTALQRRPQPSAMIEGMRARANSLNRAQQASLAADKGLPEWAISRGDLPPAKSDQVSTLPHLFQLRECLDSAGARLPVHPLISQPLIELCLALPSWQLCVGGISRGLVRQAFAGKLPDRVLQRISKGFASRYYSGRIEANRSLILETLRQGELVARGLVSRQELEAFARRDDHRWEKSGNMLLVYYGIEGWLQAWRRAGAQGFSSGSG